MRSAAKWWLGVIVALAAVFYFWQLGRADIVTDEASLATRAIGMVDFDFGIEQPTPWQWVEKIPWWMRLSFHDQPPLVLASQHLAMRLFGQTPFAVRLPSALAGLAAVIFVYFIGKRLWGAAAGLAGTALFAFTANHVWISRIGLQESILIALMLAAFAAFLRGLERPGWLPAAGALAGLAFLAKHSALILIPIFLTFPAVAWLVNKSDRRYLLNARRWWVTAAVVFLAVVSPVIIYNFGLWRTFGHFDFQFSLLFGQEVAAWQSRPGQESLGSYAERIRDFIPRLIESNSPYFLILSAVGLAVVVWQLVRSPAFVIRHSSLVIVFAWLLPFLVFIGPAARFLTLLTPWLSLAAGYGALELFRRIHPPALAKFAFATFVAFLAFETFYSYNSAVALTPRGQPPWAYARTLRRQAHAWGFNRLEERLAAELKGKMPEAAITFEYPFSRELLDRSVRQGRAMGLRPVPIGIVYNENINLASQLWVFLRRIVYDGWPVASAENFRRGGGEEFFRESGVRQILFVNATPFALQDRTRPPTLDGDIIEAGLKAAGLTPEEIKNPRGEVAFRVYELALREGN